MHTAQINLDRSSGDFGMLYSLRIMSREVNITFLGMLANQKRHYLKSYNNI
jgi:hypothetical protein